MAMRIPIELLLFLFFADRTIDPTWLRRSVPDIQAAEPGCAVKPIFGAGDKDGSALKGIARYSEVSVTTACPAGDFPNEEQIYVVLDGTGTLTSGDQKIPVKAGDFLYLPPGVPRAINGQCRFVLMGFKVPAGPSGGQIQIANLADVKQQTVGGHPDSVLYQLMIGDTKSTRDKIAAGRVVTSLYIMDFKPGGTNFPHHHEDEEEIYYLIEGRGEMVAGSGADGVAARFPSKAGDAWFFRLNCTVGFYNSTEPGAKARILAVRSLFPRRMR
jgi:mannose-6-phosphate isomerase-like protein (cupin superfamily)